MEPEASSHKQKPANFRYPEPDQLHYTINIHWSSRKVSIILVSVLWNLNFLGIFSKNKSIQNFMKIHPVGSKFFNAEGRLNRQTEHG